MTADTELCYVSAAEAITLFASNKLSPVELVQALIKRIEVVEPQVNALTYTFFDRALGQAREAEQRYRDRGRRRRQLEGIPLIIKDLHDVKGEITTYGSRLFAENRSSNSLPYVDRLLRAGAILLGRSTSPEFGLLCVCHSPLWGVTRNPWNLEYSPGGSSGGAGAALAAGMTTIADGSDYGGSIRVPASASGVFGIKPSYGRVPAGTVESLDPYHAYGPMTRTVADGALMLNVMAGQHHSDPASVPGRFRLPLKPKDIKGWRVALSMDLGYFEIDSEVVSNTLAAADAFRELGCTVDEVTIPWTKDIFEAAATHYAAYLYYEDPEQMDPEKGALLADSTLAYTAKSAARHRLSFEQAQQVRARMYADLEKIFRRYRVMLCPMLGITGVPADLPVEGVDVYINGKKQDPEWDWCLAYPFNMLGYLPIASVPSGFSSQKMPTGLQIVGQPFDEVSVFRAAYAFERVRPWMDCPERRPPL